MEQSAALDPRPGETKLVLARLLIAYPPLHDRARALHLLEAWQAAGAFPLAALSLLEKVRRLQARKAKQRPGAAPVRRRSRSSARPHAAEAGLDLSAQHKA
jgi:hypothetical protein